MKPDWDKLMKEFKGHKSTLVADADCTAAGKPLCDRVGVKGYPTIKSGDPSNLEDYQGGRDFASLKKHAESLKPSCSPSALDLCEADQKAEIEKFMAMSESDLSAAIAEKEASIEEAESTFKTKLEGLQKTYEEISKGKDDTIAEVKASGLGMMKAVQAAAKKKAEL
jgi:hypothetical protein